MHLRKTRSTTRSLESGSRVFSGDSASNSTLKRTDEAHDARELVAHRGNLRSSFSRLGSWKTAFFKAAPGEILSPNQIANEIRRLRGHDKSTVYQRHKQYYDGNKSCPNYDDLVPLCTRLINIASSDSADSITYSVTNSEYFKLCAEDPVAYEVFQHCKHRTSLKTPLSGIHSFESSNLSEDDCHRQWSKLLGSNSFKTDERSETAQSNCDALKATVLEYPKLAAEYIPYAMTLKLKGEDLELLHQLWEYFLDCVARRSEIRTWFKDMDLCFKSIVTSGKPLAYFASPLHLSRIAMYFTIHPSCKDFVFSTFFPTPKFESRKPKDPYDTKLVYYSSVGNWDIAIASNYAIAFIQQLENEVFINSTDDIKARPLFEGTVFAHSMIVHLYKIANNAITSYRYVAGVSNNGKLESSIYHALFALVGLSLKSLVTTNSLGDKKRREIQQSNFYLAHTVDVDRYHKHEVLKKIKENDQYIDLLHDRLRFQTLLRDPDGIYSLTYIPQFQNVSYLRRFRMGLNYYITADGLPGSNDQILNSWNRGVFSGDVVIDTMPLDGHVLTCLRFDRGSSVFHCTGHYAILAGVDLETGDALYVAAVRREVGSAWYFTTIRDGASSVTYADEVGEQHISRDYFVLALRHDPIDLPLRNNQHRSDVKDPTGPVYWVEFWPRRNRLYSSDEHLWDDWLLESFLKDSCERRIAEIILEGFS